MRGPWRPARSEIISKRVPRGVPRPIGSSWQVESTAERHWARLLEDAHDSGELGGDGDLRVERALLNLADVEDRQPRVAESGGPDIRMPSPEIVSPWKQKSPRQRMTGTSGFEASMAVTLRVAVKEM